VNELSSIPVSDVAEWIERAEWMLVESRRVRKLLEAYAARHGLSEPELAVLWSCTKSPPGGRPQCELAEELALSPAHISGLIERLHQAGFLQSMADGDDRRRRVWELAPAGAEKWRTLTCDSPVSESHRGAA